MFARIAATWSLGGDLQETKLRMKACIRVGLMTLPFASYCGTGPVPRLRPKLACSRCRLSMKAFQRPVACLPQAGTARSRTLEKVAKPRSALSRPGVCSFAMGGLTR